jgi:hypothetical protein
MTRSAKNWGYKKICNFTILSRRTPRGDCCESCYVWPGVRMVVIGSKFGVGRSKGFQSANPRKSAFPLKACVAYTILPCANALACDFTTAALFTAVKTFLLRHIILQ